MAFTSSLKLYLIALPIFLLLDLVWLGVIARSFYQTRLGALMRPKPNWTAAIVFYLLFVAGIVVLVLWPAIEGQSPVRASLLGAMLGLVTYAAYDLTNLAILEGFPAFVALVDILWGTVLCACVSATTYLVWFALT